MKARLLASALTVVFMSIPVDTAWAQRRGDGRHAGGNGGARVVAPRVVAVGGGPRVFFSQPYYAFRPRVQVGFGLYLGYPVAYPSVRFYPNAYPYPYQYSYPNAYPYRYYPYTQVTPMYPYPVAPVYPTMSPVYGYPAPGAIAIAPGAPSAPVTGSAPPSPATGGVSFEITPADSAVFADGVYVGKASDFSASAPPLLLAAGRHHFELRAQGLRPIAFDVDVTAGQVVPYRGTLQP